MKRIRLRYDDTAVSPIISAILLLTIMLVTVGTIMAWAIPRIQQMQYDAQYRSSFTSFQMFDSRADDVMYAAPGTTRTAGFSVPAGDLFLGRDDGYILLYWSLSPDPVIFTSVDSRTGAFSFIFENRNGDNLTVNITGSDINDAFTSVSGPTDHPYLSGAIMGTVEPGIPFGRFQYIRIHNASTDIAEACYFRMRAVEHQLSTSSGYYEIKWLNGALITNRGSSAGSVSGVPYVYPREGDLTIQMIDLSVNRSGFGAAGPGTYDITIRKSHTISLIDKPVHSFRMSYHTEYSRGWHLYFHFHRNFDFVKNARYDNIALGYRPGQQTNLTLALTGLELTGVTR